MLRQLRVEYPGAIYHLMSRSNGKGGTFSTETTGGEALVCCEELRDRRVVLDVDGEKVTLMLGDAPQ